MLSNLGDTQGILTISFQNLKKKPSDPFYPDNPFYPTLPYDTEQDGVKFASHTNLAYFLHKKFLKD